MSLKTDFIKSLIAGNRAWPHLNAVIIAQAIHETADFTSKLAVEHHNFFGIKWRPEMSAYAAPITVKVPSESAPVTFCHFNALSNSIAGYFRFLARSPYSGWESHSSTGEEFIKFIGRIWCDPAADAHYVEQVLAKLPQAKSDLIAAGGTVTTPVKPTGKRALLDPGHSDMHVGARSNSNKVLEEVLNRAQAVYIKRVLEAAGIVATIYDPPADGLGDIGSHARGYDCFVSLHHNSYDGDADLGTEVLFDNDKAKASSKVFAADLCNRISIALGTKNRGSRAQGLGVLDAAEQVCSGPCVLCESYFLNPYNDQAAAIKRSEKAAEAIAQGIISFLTDSEGVIPVAVKTYTKGQNIQLSKNFHLSEWACKCSRCSTVKVDSTHVANLQKLRDKLGKPISINSAYRCPAHNAEVGGVPNSEHVQGCATDIVVAGMSPSAVANACESFDGLGRYASFTHVDSRGSQARWNGLVESDVCEM